MPIVRLEVDLDSDVYPELHAALMALRSARARGERFRQLAATGLVWEMVRVRGPAAIGPGLAAAVAPVPAPVAPLPPVLQPAPVPEVRAPRPARTSERRATPRPRAAEPRGPDFIDLAIDAPPLPPPMPVDADGVARELPVLRDVVADEDAPLVSLPHDAVDAGPGVAADDADDDTAHPVARAAGAVPTALPVVDGDDTALPDAIHLTSLAHKPASRSRLMRMKEKGLFKNG